MKRFTKLGITLFAVPLVFSCASGTNDSNFTTTSTINAQCTIDVYCDNCYFATGTNPDESMWSKEGSLSASTGERLEIYFKAKTGYNLPSNVYSIREKETGTDIDEYVFKDEDDYKKIIFTPTTSTVIQMVADYDCVNITWSTTANDEIVGFSYNGGLNFVDWGDGEINSESTHKYKMAKSYTAKICGDIDSIMVGSNNPTNLYCPGNQDIKEVEIKDTITSIPTGAFSNLVNLEKISIANSVTNIAKRSFSGTNALKNISFEEDNPTFKSFNGSDIVNTTTKTLIYSNSNDKIASTVNKIADYAFEGSTIKNIAIPKNITSIGSGAFNNCTSLKSLDLTDYTTPPTISSDSFPDSITSIQTADDKVAYLFNEAWHDFPSITNKISYPSSGEFQILPLEDGKLTLTGVPTSAVDAQSLQFFIKNYNDDYPEWVQKNYSAPAGGGERLYTICNVKANKPVAIKAVTNNTTMSVVYTPASETATSASHWTFSCSNSDDTDVVPYSVSGRLLSLIDQEFLNEDNPQEMPDGAHFSYLFDEGLIDASNLVMGSTVGQACYMEMFKGCTSLVSAPKLPCDNIVKKSVNEARSCYAYMFSDCSSLISAPELPSTTTTRYCYAYMFNKCSSLKEAPNLPATLIDRYCYGHMFYYCTSLIKAPNLPATTTAGYGYYCMFSRCTSLVNPPLISATSIDEYCCSNMFAYCSLLESAPKLSATSIGSYGCAAMFTSCSALTKCCELPATDLAESCYRTMFKGCSSLTKGPTVLPAETLPNACYYQMFYQCSKLIIPPIIKATSCGNSSFYQMFYSCRDLVVYPGESGTVFFDSTNFVDTQMVGMFQGTGGTATATPAKATLYSYTERPCLAFTSSNDAAMLGYEIVGSSLPDIKIQISNDLMNWKDWNGDAVTIPNGTCVYVKNLSNTLSTSDSYFHFLTKEAYLTVSGPIDSLINFAPLSDYCYYHLFEGFTFGSTTAVAFSLPSISLKKYCYCSMFEGASGFRTAPDLPATTLSEGCYMNMFKGITALTVGGTSAKFGNLTLEAYSCYGMFENCGGVAPAGVTFMKNIMSLADHSCERMFYNCTKVKIYENGTNPEKLIFTCPSTATLIDPTKDMFYGTGGDFTGTPVGGNNYYSSLS